MDEGTGLLLKILQVTGLSCGNDADGADLYCVLSTGTCRLTTRSLPSKCNNSYWSESFLLGPKDLKHASQCVTSQAASKPVSSTVSSSASATSSTSSTGSPASSSSPVLTIELRSSKRWGSDTVTAAGELLLGPYLSSLQPNGPAQQLRVALRNPKASSKASARSGEASAVGASSSPGLDSGWVLGAEVQCMLLEISALAAPRIPINLLGPVGSGRIEVSPSHSSSSSWLNAQRPVLHTSGGQLYQTPTVQHIKVTLHRAQGLQNLHVDPQAAAAAAAAMMKLAAAGEVSSRAERAKLAAVSAVVDGTKAGRTLLTKTSSWFSRNKPAALAAGSATAFAARTLSTTSRTTSTAAAERAAAAAQSDTAPVMSTLASSSDASFNSSRVMSPLKPGMPQQPAADSPRSAAADDDSSSVDSRDSPARRGSTTTPLTSGAYVCAADEQSVAADVGGSSSADKSADSSAPSLQLPDSLPAAAAVLDELAALGSPAGAASSSAVGVDDPVSLLQQATYHLRSQSVDTDAVIAALEENGFHATDAPGGAYVYARLGLSCDADKQLSRVVELRPGGEAVWEQSFWLSVTRPAAATTCLEVELFASNNDKSRGRSVAVVSVPLHQLLQLDSQQPGGSGSTVAPASGQVPWLRTQQTLQASLSDHLRCGLLITVEAADWDVRAELLSLPRALQQQQHSTAEANSGRASPAPSSAQQQQQQVKRQQFPGAMWSPGSPSRSPRDSPRKMVLVSGDQTGERGALMRQQAGSDDSSRPGSGQLVSAGNSSSNALGRQVGSEAGEGAMAAAAAATTTADGTAAEDKLPGVVAYLDVVVKAFETRKPCDAFFVLLVGPYCLVSSTTHSSHHHRWGWHLHLGLQEPADMLTLALFAREDQSGGKKKVAASMMTMFNSSIKLVGKCRIRISTITPNAPLNISMPLQGERSNLRSGHPAAATVHLYLHLVVPQLFGSYLLSYFRYTACSPALYLLANTSANSGSSGTGNPDCSLDALAAQAQQTTARWLESQAPGVPLKVFRKVQDDGRVEFTLSRTRSNWRRLILLRESLAPVRDVFNHLCSWDNYLHSGACYCVIVLFGMYPSKVLSLALLLLSVMVARAATSSKSSMGPSSGSKPAGQPASAVNVSSAAAGCVSGGWASRCFSQLVPVRPPPVMNDPGLLSNAAEEQQQGSVVVADAYTSLKQNYEGLVLFLTLVQNVVDGWAAAGERLQSAFTWSDQLATSVMLMLMVLLSVGLWVLGLRLLVTLGLLWVFRHPWLRDPLPPPPVNFIGRMPTRSDTLL